MAEIDRRAIESQIDGLGLMRRAGAAVAAAALAHWPATSRAVVLCGPGNNGGDGHVAARLLSEAGMACERYGVAPRPGTDAAAAFSDFPGDLSPLSAYQPVSGDLVVDALFGAGLDRPLEGEFAHVIERIARACVPVLAVDLPSGLSGLTGQPAGQTAGAVVRADRTVTFAGLKPGHLLMPGRELCGIVEIADIGIPARLLASDDPLWRNSPRLYLDLLPKTGAEAHKFSRGHLAVFSGPLISGGASRLAAMAGLRIGAGLVTLATPPGAVMAQAAHLTAIMQRRIGEDGELEAWLEDRRLSAFVLGPGFGDLDLCRTHVRRLSADGRPVVLDADAISAFSDDAAALGDLFSGTVRLVLTPHEGEFRRLFGDLDGEADLSKVDRARLAARRINGVIVYKGPDTVIAAPDGRAAINVAAPPWLATAGTGDVLTGMVGGLLAQGMPAFEAACAAVALHGEAAISAGPGMISEDLVSEVGRSRG